MERNTLDFAKFTSSRAAQRAKHRNNQRAHDSSSDSSSSESPPRSTQLGIRSTKTQLRRCQACNVKLSHRTREETVIPECGHAVCARCRPSSFFPGACPVCSSTLSREETTWGDRQMGRQTDQCPMHHQPLVGYCSNDQTFICGECLFNHRCAYCIRLNSQQFHTLLTDRRKDATEKESELVQIKSMWEHAQVTAKTKMDELHGIAENCINTLRQTREAMVRELTQKTDACISQIQKFVRLCPLPNFQLELNNKLSKINTQLETLRRRNLQFDHLPLLEKFQDVSIKVEVPRDCSRVYQQIESLGSSDKNYPTFILYGHFPLPDSWKPILDHPNHYYR